MQREECGTCTAWLRSWNGTSGTCRRNPPVVLTIDADDPVSHGKMEVETVWPRVYEDDAGCMWWTSRADRTGRVGMPERVVTTEEED